MRSSRSRRAPNGVVLVSLAGVVWGTAPVAFSLVVDRTPLTSTAISSHRLTIAAVVLLLMAGLAGQRRVVVRLLRDRPTAVVAIGIGVAGYQALWFAAISHVGASIATVVSLGLAPILVTVWETWRDRARPSVTHVLVVTGAVLGLALVSLAPSHQEGVSTDSVLGLVLASCSGTLYAGTTVLSRHVAPRVPPLALTTATTSVGAVVLLPVAALTGPILTADPASVVALGYLGVITMAAGYLLLYAGLRTAAASVATVATLLEPVVATVLAVTLLGERLTLTATVGIVLVLAAVAALNAGDRKVGPPMAPR